MTKTIIFSAAVALGLFACGDDNKAPDAPRSIDAPPADAPGFPVAPTLGSQIDRMGRPAINTALNDLTGADGSAKTAAKDAYNEDQSPSNWTTMFGSGFAASAAILDALDKGLLTETMGTANAAAKCKIATGTSCTADSDCTGAGDYCLQWTCSNAATACGRDADCGAGTCIGEACGNQVFYDGQTAGDRGVDSAASYATVAGVLTDDELYLDTTQTTCNQYLAVEFNYALSGLHLGDCGGRTPSEDVMSLTYSLVAAGVSGVVQATLAPLFMDYSAANPVVAHTDITTTFPFFGAPH